MVQWIEADQQSQNDYADLGITTKLVEVTAERVADITAEVFGDFALQKTAEELSEKYGLPVDNVFQLGDTILQVGGLAMIFDPDEIYRLEEIDGDILKTIFTIAFLIGYRIPTSD